MGRNIFGDDGAGADEGVSPDSNLRSRSERHAWLRRIVTAGAEINFRGDGGALAEFDFTKQIGISTVSETGTIVQNQLPRDCNSRARMHEGRPLDLRFKYVQPKKSPWIEWLWSPPTKNEPAEFP